MLLNAMVVLGAALTAAVTEGHELTVAPDGLSPAEAILRIRAAKEAGDKGAWTVRVKSGIYSLKEPLVLTPADSGTPGAPVTWIGSGEDCVFVGGQRVTGWRDDGDGVWSAAIPKESDGRPMFFEQLWVNGRRADRARLPNAGYFKTTGMTCDEQKGVTPQNFIERLVVTDKAAAPLAKTPADELAFAQMCLVDKWTFARRILRGVETVSNGVAVTTHAPSAWPVYARWSAYNTIVAFENVRSAFDAPGEWFYDAKASRVLYRPLPGEEMSAALVLAPSQKTPRLLEVKGEPEKGRYVTDVRFRGIAFEGTGSKTLLTDVVAKATKGAYVPPAEGPTESWQYQAAQSCDAAVQVEGGRRLSWRDCFLRHTANYGFRFNDGCVSNEVVCCRLEDLGAGGLWIGARGSYPPPGTGELSRRAYRTIGPKSTAYNLVSNCVIRCAGRFNPEGTGVVLSHASNCRVIHNDIGDVYYTGVSVGWVWGYRGSVAQDNEIAYNRIWDLGKGVMSDMGGVYTLATSYGTKVHHNVVHDVKSYTYGGWGLYTDEGSEGIVFEYNLVWNTTDGGFHQHFGTGCTIRNNVFCFNAMNGAVRFSKALAGNVPSTLNFINNVVYTEKGFFVTTSSAGYPTLLAANNVWWDGGRKITFDGADWETWRKRRLETNGRYADPLFVDAQKLDFRLKDESPAFAVGFEAWDYSTAGAK